MTDIMKSTIVELTGALVRSDTVALPLQAAFYEGGARRDVVHHAAESEPASMDMLYLVEFEAHKQELRAQQC